jgi:hypothetical protein
MNRARFAALLPPAVLVVLSLLVRAPALLNAAATNSDAAIVGLQAMHLLRGEWDPFLWGSSYQTSSDGVVAALFFALLGPTPRALMLSSLALHTGATLFAYYALAPRVRSPRVALVAALLLVFTTACVHSYALYPPRELSLMLAMGSLCTLARAQGPLGRAGGGALASLAVYTDPYVLLFLPALFVFALATARGPALAARVRAFGITVVGAALGAIPFVLLSTRPRAKHGVESFRFDLVSHNLELFARDCMPWALGTKIFRPVHMMDYAPLPTSSGVHALQLGGALVLFVLIGAAGLVVKRAPRLFAPWLFGAVLFLTTVVAFQISPMVMDHFSMRYLAAMVFALPLLVAPALDELAARAPRMGAGLAALALAPYLAVAGSAGWIAHGPYVDGAVPVRCDAGRAEDEARLLAELRARGIDVAIADYWAAYRLTFLFREDVVVVPLHPEQDRYAPYRARVERAETVAYVHDALRSFEDRAATEHDLAERFDLDGEPKTFGPFTVRVLRRRAAPSASSPP